jgi:hypothetical protein
MYSFYNAIFKPDWTLLALRAFPEAEIALFQGKAFVGINAKLWSVCNCLGIAAPQAAHCAAGKKQRRPNSRPVMNSVFLYIAN